MRVGERRFRSLLALTILLFGHPDPAKAEQPSAVEDREIAELETRLQLSFTAPESCPNEEEFRRLLKTNLTNSSETSIRHERLLIEITQEGPAFEGSFRVEGQAGAVNARVISGERCDEVLAALSVVAAIALDPLAKGKNASSSGEEISTAAEQTSSPSPVASSEGDKDPAGASDKKLEPDRPGSVARRPSWMRPFHLKHQTQVEAGELKVEAAVAFDVQAGINYGLTPGAVTPRLDLSARTAIFLQAPGQSKFLLGLIPRIHFSFYEGSVRPSEDYLSNLTGFTFAAGLCGSPYYDPDGLVFLLCGEYGGGTMSVSTESSLRDFKQDLKIGVSKVGLSAELEYALPWALHLGLRTGVEFLGAGDYRIEGANQEELFRLGKNNFFTTMGIGFHF